MFIGKEVTPVEKHYILLMNAVVLETARQPVKARSNFLQKWYQGKLCFVTKRSDVGVLWQVQRNMFFVVCGVL